MEKIRKTSLKQDIIITLLLQGINNISKTIVKKEDENILNVLKNTLNKINIKLESNFNIVNDLQTDELQNQLNSLDSIVEILQTSFSLLLKVLDIDNKKYFKKEYKRLLNNLNDFRESIEIFKDVELWEEVSKINNGTFNRSNYVSI